MSDAYRCDKCGEFKEGESFATAELYETTDPDSSPLIPTSKDEFCERCYKEYRKWVKQSLDTGDGNE